ncbi:hypothetical protein [Nonomuraea basaltis]|uniref:hypothetical protein n=1 Tax=Nonomuraea basaltis TaxID=2495887 RepID=UPI0019821835|nr:hypothetical protein [Nonomuraea basaltis]
MKKYAICYIIVSVDTQDRRQFEPVTAARRAAPDGHRHGDPRGSTVVYALSSADVANLMGAARQIMTDMIAGQGELMDADVPPG